MGKTHFSGPIKVGPRQFSTGTTLGTNVANIGFVLMAQSIEILEQAAVTPLKTGIVLPAKSQIVDATGVCTVAYNAAGGTNEKVGLGITSSGVDITADFMSQGAGDIAKLDMSSLTGGGVAGTMVVLAATGAAAMKDVGDDDVAVWYMNTSVGTPVQDEGRITLTVTYIQANDLT